MPVSRALTTSHRCLSSSPVHLRTRRAGAAIMLSVMEAKRSSSERRHMACLSAVRPSPFGLNTIPDRCHRRVFLGCAARAWRLGSIRRVRKMMRFIAARAGDARRDVGRGAGGMRSSRRAGGSVRGRRRYYAVLISSRQRRHLRQRSTKRRHQPRGEPQGVRALEGRTLGQRSAAAKLLCCTWSSVGTTVTPGHSEPLRRRSRRRVHCLIVYQKLKVVHRFHVSHRRTQTMQSAAASPLPPSSRRACP